MSGVCVQGLMSERKVFEVHIEQGHKYGAKVVLRGEAGMSELGVLPGDVIFVLEAKPHKIFKRANNDLVMEKVCSLALEQLDYNGHLNQQAAAPVLHFACAQAWSHQRRFFLQKDTKYKRLSGKADKS